MPAQVRKFRIFVKSRDDMAGEFRSLGGFEDVAGEHDIGAGAVTPALRGRTYRSRDCSSVHINCTSVQQMLYGRTVTREEGR